MKHKFLKFISVFLLLMSSLTAWGATTSYTVYFCPGAAGKSWTTPYVNCNKGWNDWQNYSMSKSSFTFHGYDVYQATIVTHDGGSGFDEVCFHPSQNDYTTELKAPTGWPFSYGGKIYDGSNWQNKAEDSEQTFYFCPKCAGKDWTTPYANCNLGYNHWSNVQMTEVSGKTFCGQKVYQATVTTCAFDKIEFHKSSSDYSGKIELSNPSGVNGKLYNGSEWKTFSYDTEYTFYFATDWSAVYANCNLGYNLWKDLAMTNTGKTYNGKKIYSITVAAQGFNDIEFHKSNGGDWDSKVVGYSNSTTYKKDFTNALCTSANTWVAYNYDVTLTFDPKNGGATTNKVTLKGGSITAPSAPSKTGYTFQGWGTNKVAAGGTISNVQADATYDAQWTANTNTPYTVKHYKQNLDGTYPSTATETENLTGTTDASVTPAVKNYTGFTAPTPQTVTIAADGSLVVTYNYTRNSHTLIWNADGGTITGDYTSGTVKYGATITAPANANVTKDGFNFMGWMVNNDVVTPATTMPDNDLTYTAKWQSAATYSLTLVKGTGIESVSGGISDQTVLPIVSDISATVKTGYTFAEWTKTGEGEVSYTTGSANSANATVSVTVGSVTLTASATPNTNTAYTVKHYKQNLSGDSYELADTDNLTGTTDAQVTPAVKDYTGFTAPSTQTVTIKGDGTTEVTYNYTRNSYTLTWAGLEGATAQGGTSAGSVKYGATLTAPTVEKNGYNFTGWNPSVPATMPAANSTYTAQWSEIIHTITIANGTAASTTAGVETEGTAMVRALAADEKFTGWTIPSGITLTQGDANSTTIKFHANADDLTVTANIAKKTLVKLYFANYAEWPTVKAYAYGNGEGNNNTWPGEATTEETINCVTYKVFSYYSEDHSWTTVIFNNGQESDNCKTEDLTISGNEGKYYMPNGWKQGATGLLTGAWQAEPYATLWAFHVKESGAEHGEDYLVDCANNQTTANLKANTHYVFKAHNYVTGKWYGNNNSDSYIRSSIENWDFYSENTGDCNMQTNDAGTYTFAISQFVSSSQVKVSVTYPAAQTYTVTMANDGNGTTTPATTIELNEFTGTQISATPATGYHFDKWVGTTGITFTDANAATTTAKASQTGTITATFAKNTPIYFKNAIKTNWNPEHLYIYLYKDNTYWEGTGDDKQDRGTGSNKSMYSGSCIAGPIEMTHIQNTDIWEYDYDPALSFNTIVFAEQPMDGYEWFANCTAVRRADYNSCMNMFVLNNATEEWHNETARYFNKGFWKSYDAESAKLYIHMEGQSEMEFNTKESPNEYSHTHKLTPSGSGTEYYDYYFYIGACNGKNYSVEGGTITPEHPTITLYEFELNPKEQNKQVTLKANVQGDYKFTVIHNDDNTLTLTVDYPYGVNDYRVVSVHSATTHENGYIYKSKDTTYRTSFYVQNGDVVKVQYISNIQGEVVTWSDVTPAVSVTVSGLETPGVYNFDFTKNGTSLSLTQAGAYSGNYYIRTDGVDGGWTGYMQSADNEMIYYGSMLNAGVTYGNFPYDFYKTKWINKDVNVKFCIANDYSKDLTGYFESDNIIDKSETLDVAEQTLPQSSNVRFMWNSSTNQLKRAYISGSTNISDRFLVLEGDAKMFDSQARALTTEGGGKIAGLNDYELNFADKNNWVYQADIKAQPGCAVKLTAVYNGKVQYFIGAEGDEAGSRDTIIKGSSTDKTKYTMRVVYDFKTNLLIAGWMPSDTIKSNIALGGDMLITRTHQDSAQQIIFGGNVSISDIHHVYGVLTIKKDTMLGKNTSPKYKTPATNTDYDRTMYWISFPFKVKISEIFGVDGYGTKWIMQKYRGDLRAQKGWFKEDTPTFWEYMDIKDSLNAYEGYLFLLDANYFNKESADVWKNSATEANFYFPSASGNIGIINKSSFTQPVPAHVCGIDREFEVEDVGTVNHKNTDSYWNVIGVPAFQNKSMVLGTETETNMKAIYKWNSEYNTYTPQALADEFRFQTMHAYMVQFGGDITWSDVSVVNNNPATAPRYAYADTKNYFIKLFFGNGEAEDHAYINLADEASTDFVLNEDMMKLDNAGFPNIYSFAGNYNVAYNETKMVNQIVTLGVSAPKNGTYTFSMPKEFSGTAQLFDMEDGSITDLNLSNYTVELNKGTYNNRFQLMLEVEAKVPTSIQADRLIGGKADGKTLKLLRNGNIYLINGGRIYNVLGVEE